MASMALSHYGENTTHAMRRPDWEMSSMKTKRVYDYPTRVFHWLFALLFVIAFTIGTTVDDDSALFLFHMLAGLVLCALVLFRVIWGFVGTKHARFSGFGASSKGPSSLRQRHPCRNFEQVARTQPRLKLGSHPDDGLCAGAWNNWIPDGQRSGR